MMAVNMGIYSGCINSLIYPCLRIEIFLEWELLVILIYSEKDILLMH